MDKFIYRFLNLDQHPENRDEAELEWVALSADHQQEERGVCKLAELREVTKNHMSSASVAVLLIPDDSVLFVRLDVPGSTASRMRKAIPYSVEPYLTDNIEDTHVATGSVTKNQPVECMAVSKSVLSAYLELIDDSGAPLDCATTAGSIIAPSGDVGTTYLFEDSHCLVRTSDDTTTFTRSDLNEIANIVDDGESIEKIAHVVAAELSDNERVILNTLSQPVEIIDVSEGILPYIAHQFEEKTAINLLSGEFSSAKTKKVSLSEWKTAAVYIVALGVVCWATILAQGAWANYQFNELRTQTEDLYKSLYGEAPYRRDPAASMLLRLGGSGDHTGSFEVLFGALMDSVKAIGGSMSITYMTYSQEDGELSVNCTLDGYERIDQLKRRIEQEEFTMDLLSAENSPDGVVANIKMTAL